MRVNSEHGHVLKNDITGFIKTGDFYNRRGTVCI